MVRLQRIYKVLQAMVETVTLAAGQLQSRKQPRRPGGEMTDSWENQAWLPCNTNQALT